MEEKKKKWYQGQFKGISIFLGKGLLLVLAIILAPVLFKKWIKYLFPKEEGNVDSNHIVTIKPDPAISKKKVKEYKDEESRIVEKAKKKKLDFLKFLKKSGTKILIFSILIPLIFSENLKAKEPKLIKMGECCQILDSYKKEVLGFLDIQAKTVKWELINVEEKPLIFLVKYRGVTKSKSIIYIDVPLDKKFIKVKHINPTFWNSKWPWIGIATLEFIFIVIIAAI